MQGAIKLKMLVNFISTQSDMMAINSGVKAADPLQPKPHIKIKYALRI